jgi:DNA-binding NarL/FixJ family response regulator
MANHSFETSGFEALEVSSTNDLAFTPVEQFVPARGWSCSQDRRGERPLTTREQQILTLIIEGKTPKEVAYDLEIAHSTVRVIYSRAMKKLGGVWQPNGRKR